MYNEDVKEANKKFRQLDPSQWPIIYEFIFYRQLKALSIPKIFNEGWDWESFMQIKENSGKMEILTKEFKELYDVWVINQINLNDFE